MKAVSLGIRGMAAASALARPAHTPLVPLRSRSFAESSAMPPESNLRFAKEVTLKDGTKAQISLLKEGDSEQLRAFYDQLSSYSYLKGDRCSDRNPGVPHGSRLHETAMSLLGDPHSRVIVARADVDGQPKIVGACMMNYVSTTCLPHRIVVADAMKLKGVGVAMKVAQMQLAQADGMSKMESGGNGPAELEKLYVSASKALGLSVTRAPVSGPMASFFAFPNFYQLEVDLSARAEDSSQVWRSNRF